MTIYVPGIGGGSPPDLTALTTRLNTLEAQTIGNTFRAGSAAGEAIGSNGQSVFIGHDAGKSYSGTPGSIHIGYENGTKLVSNPAGANGTSGGLQNTSVGRRTMWKATDAYFCTAMGGNTLLNLTVGKANTAVGHQSLREAVDVLDTSAFGEGAFANLISGNGNTGLGVNAGLLTGLQYIGREYFNTGRISSVAKDVQNFPVPANYFTDVASCTYVGPGAGYTMSGNNNVACGVNSMFGVVDDNQPQGATSNTLTLHERSVPEDNFYVPISLNSYKLAIISGVGGGSEVGDTYFNGGIAHQGWQANEVVTTSTYRVAQRLGTPYRWLMRSKSNRTTSSAFNSTEEANWRYVAIEHVHGSITKYYQIAEVIGYVGSTKVATIQVDGGNWDTVPNTTSRYRYTLAPFRFKIPATGRDYNAYNNAAIGGNSLQSIDDGDHNAVLGWSSFSNLEHGTGNVGLGAYSGRLNRNGVAVSDANRATCIGYQAPYIANDTVTLGGAGDNVVVDASIITATDSRLKNNITTPAATLGMAFVNALAIKTYRNAGSTKTHLGILAQDVQAAFSSLGLAPESYAMIVDHTENGGIDELGTRENQLIYNALIALKQLHTRVTNLENA
jgi:hypothetical protein